MKEIDPKELKKTEFEILTFVDGFCRENGIKYSLTGGTLLGAVRHKGFIPWDDDVDVMLDRKNYELFIEKFSKCANNSYYELITYENSENYNYLFAKVVDTRTELIEDHNKRVKNFGVFIDIFPMDYIDDDYNIAMQKLKSIETKKYLAVASNWRHFYINKNHGFLRQILRFFFFLGSRFIRVKKMLRKIEEQFKNNTSGKYMCCIGGSYKPSKEIMESSIMDDYIDLEFEGSKFMAISRYDERLKAFYGNYMELPPVEQRIARHTFVAYKKD